MWNSFVQDDAFISYRYALNFSNGHGLVWDTTQLTPLEGYTNFLWTVCIAFFIRIGCDPVLSAIVCGCCLAIGTLLLTYRLAGLILRNRTAAIGALMLLATNYTFICFMSGGLETQLHVFLIVCIAYFSLMMIQTRCYEPVKMLSLSILCALAFMTRMDSAILCLCFIVPAGIHVYTAELQSGRRWNLLLLLVAPGLCIAGIWLLWKAGYYGGIFPNSFYLKAVGSSAGICLTGLRYLFIFTETYLLLPLALLAVMHYKTVFKDSMTRYMAVAVLAWCFYLIKVGGGFMEFRLLVPVVPFIMILSIRLLQLCRNVSFKAAIIITLIFGSFFHGYSFDSKYGIESVKSLKGHLFDDGEQWIEVGKALHSAFNRPGTDITIATTAAGAIPYYAQLPAVDMLGVNDAWCVDNGIVIGNRPGHRRMCTLDYIRQRGVNLVLGHPCIKPAGSKVAALRELLFIMPNEAVLEQVLPEQGVIIALPVKAGYVVNMLYLLPHPAIDAYIQRENLNTYTVSR